MIFKEPDSASQKQFYFWKELEKMVLTNTFPLYYLKVHLSVYQWEWESTELNWTSQRHRWKLLRKVHCGGERVF